MTILNTQFFNQDACELAKALLGKVIRVLYQGVWLSAQVTETEAYYIDDKASHASLGYTEKRKALFMPPGTIYMYYARGGDSLNVSAKGEGNAVLIKSGVPYLNNAPENMIKIMQTLNPINGRVRDAQKLCAGQTLLCKALNITVPKWNKQQFDSKQFYLEDVGEAPQTILALPRKGIAKGRDEHLPYRFVLN